jgi:hypothetical protein
MLKQKSKAADICTKFGKGFRPIAQVQKAFNTRPSIDEAICAVLWEYKDRGKKGYDLTEKFFFAFREKFKDLPIIGPERAGKDVLMGEVWKDYTKPDRPVDFVIFTPDKKEVLVIGLAIPIAFFQTKPCDWCWMSSDVILNTSSRFSACPKHARILSPKPPAQVIPCATSPRTPFAPLRLRCLALKSNDASRPCYNSQTRLLYASRHPN